jgi:3-phosphoshikimate 1-carboxyvinyltransferase
MEPAFSFRGPLPPSKSILIRHHLLALYEPRITIPISSRCADVVGMERACAALRSPGSPRVVDCGEAGLVLRLCLGFASRQGGSYVLTGSPRLIARPHAQLLGSLERLGTRIEVGPVLKLSSNGWREVAEPLALADGSSSQFASSLILNAWDLPFALQLDVGTERVSDGYLAMSIELARRFGMDVEWESERIVRIAPAQKPRPGVCTSEADTSSAFAVAAVAAVAGRAEITNFPEHSLQPDAAFPAILARMGVRVERSGRSGRSLSVERSGDGRGALRPIEVDLGGCPDLAPVLAVLCALADGESRLYGAPHLRGKESDRIATTAALLRALHREVTEREDGLLIRGRALSAADRERAASFDAGSDHRLVMAAAVAWRAGFPLQITGTHAVAKSFPEFLEIVGLV